MSGFGGQVARRRVVCSCIRTRSRVVVSLSPIRNVSLTCAARLFEDASMRDWHNRGALLERENTQTGRLRPFTQYRRHPRQSTFCARCACPRGPARPAARASSSSPTGAPLPLRPQPRSPQPRPAPLVAPPLPPPTAAQTRSRAPVPARGAPARRARGRRARLLPRRGGATRGRRATRGTWVRVSAMRGRRPRGARRRWR